MSAQQSMRAIVMRQSGGPEVLEYETLPKPVPKLGWVLIRVKAFGLNRSELFTRQGHSPNVALPRVLGIECVGIVEHDPSGELRAGQTIATAMGGMGRQFNGSYAEYTCVPFEQVKALDTHLDWAQLGALPEMIQTAWGSLNSALAIKSNQTLLIRGGTTSVGLAAAILAKTQGLRVIATTRNPQRRELLLKNGADEVLIDNGQIVKTLRQKYPKGVEKVLELVGTTSLKDSLQCAAQGGTVCMTGMVGNAWEFDKFSPMGSIPSTVSLTTYSGGSQDFINTPLKTIIHGIEQGRTQINCGPVFKFEEIVEAHHCMEENTAGGKIVVVL